MDKDRLDLLSRRVKKTENAKLFNCSLAPGSVFGR